MEPLMHYLTAFGLASGAGLRAFIPLLALGAFHYTPYFKLSPPFEWIASPPVMVVLGILTMVEIWLDSHPDLGEHLEFLSYLPKFVVGFIAFAAATGKVDSSLMEFGASGVLGGTTGAAVNYLRSKLRRPVRDYAEDLHEHVGKAASLGEAGAAATISVTAILVPLATVLALAATGSAGWYVARRADARRVPCVHCGQPIRPGAAVCMHCKKEQAAPAAPVSEEQA
jgi:hypothetical protein